MPDELTWDERKQQLERGEVVVISKRHDDNRREHARKQNRPRQLELARSRDRLDRERGYIKANETPSEDKLRREWEREDDRATSREQREAEVPETEDELHDFILETYGFDIPQVAVCEGHSSPMSVLWELFSRAHRAFLIIGSRGSGKTLMAALLHLLLARFHAGHESMQFGAIERQARRCYDLLRKLLQRESGTSANAHPLVAESLRSRTEFVNGSSVEIAPLTVNATNSPHVPLVVVDELETLPPENADAWEESRNVAAGDGTVGPLDVVTSTRKWVGSRVSNLVAEQEEAVARGEDPTFQVRWFCVFETAQRVPECGQRNEDGSLACGCDRVIKGQWSDGSPRTFADVCRPAKDAPFGRRRFQSERPERRGRTVPSRKPLRLHCSLLPPNTTALRVRSASARGDAWFRLRGSWSELCRNIRGVD